MKDSIALLVTAVVVAALSWAFWRYAGQDAFWIFSSAVMAGLCIDNMRLRRLLRDRGRT